jgi:hypothetical protein
MPTQEVEVRASSQPSQVTAAYGITTGSITLNVSGLPPGAPAAVNVSGPGGYYQTVTQSVTLASLTPGSYSIINGSVGSGGHTYSPVPLSQTVNILATATPYRKRDLHDRHWGPGGHGNGPASPAERERHGQRPGRL